MIRSLLMRISRVSTRVLSGYLMVVMLAVTTVGCSRINREQLLIQQADEFHNNLRWKRLEVAAIRVVPWKREELFDVYHNLQDTLQIEEHEFVRVQHPLEHEKGYSKEPTLATMKLYRYQYELPSVTRQKVELNEKWLYNDGGWFLYDGLVSKDVPSR